MLAQFPSLHVRAYSPGDNPAGLQPASLSPALDLLQTPPDGDAMLVAYRLSGGGNFPRLTGPAGAYLADKGEPVVLCWVFLDIDRPGHAAWASKEAAAAWVDSLLGIDSPLVERCNVYTTRAGARVFWRLSTPVPVDRANGLVSNVLRAFSSQTGIPVDDNSAMSIDGACAQWTRMFRHPLALRDGHRLDPVTDYTALELGADLDVWSGGFVPESSDVAPVAAGDHGPCPEAPVDLDIATWSSCASALPHLLRGEPFQARDDATVYQQVRTTLARLASNGRECDPHVLLSLVWESVAATPGRDPSEFWGLACWVAAQEAETQAQLKAVSPDAPPPTGSTRQPTPEEWASALAALRSRRTRALLERCRNGQPVSGQQALKQLVNLVQGLHAAGVVRSPSAALGYVEATAQESRVSAVALWDAIVGVCQTDPDPTVEDRAATIAATTPLTLKVKGGGLWQLDARDLSRLSYVEVDKDTLLSQFSRLTERGLGLEGLDYDRPLSRILNQYGAQADKLVYRSGLRGNVYDASTRRLDVGVHVLADAPPVFHDEVDKWLRLLPPPEHLERFLDYLACVTLLTDPIAALYLEGPPGVGKTLLANGLGSLWGTPPADFNQMLADSFTSALRNSPVLLADEGVQVTSHNQAKVSEVFRSYVSNSHHTVRAMYQEATDLHGCFRLIITANDEDALPFRQAMGEDGIRAITSRVLYIKSGPEAGDYLNSLNGRQGTRGWLGPHGGPGKIAEHLMWLRDNRAVERGPRFLVEGVRTEWHAAFSANQGLKPHVLWVCSKLAHELHVGSPIGDGSALGEDGGRRVLWVSGRTVHDLWSRFGDGRRPDVMRLNKTLGQISGSSQAQRKRINGVQRRVYAIPVDLLVSANMLDAQDLDANEPAG